MQMLDTDQFSHKEKASTIHIFWVRTCVSGFSGIIHNTGDCCSHIYKEPKGVVIILEFKLFSRVCTNWSLGGKGGKSQTFGTRWLTVFCFRSVVGARTALLIVATPCRTLVCAGARQTHFKNYPTYSCHNNYCNGRTCVKKPSDVLVGFDFVFVTIQ